MIGSKSCCAWYSVSQMNQTRFDREFVLKWSANLVIVAATMTTAFDITPINKLFFLLGCIMWAWVGMLWRQPSLWSLNLFCGIIYLAGLIQ